MLIHGHPESGVLRDAREEDAAFALDQPSNRVTRLIQQGMVRGGRGGGSQCQQSATLL